MFKPMAFTLAGLLLCGCASDSADLPGGPIPAGEARIVVYAGHWYSGGVAFSYPQSFLVTVDGVAVGQVGKDEAIAVDVPPGHHMVGRTLVTLWSVLPNTVSADLGNVAEGTQITIAVNRVAGGMEAQPSTAEHIVVAAPHPDPGDYLDNRNDDPGLLHDRAFVTPDAAAVAKLNRR
jgi:hypothetical protein